MKESKQKAQAEEKKIGNLKLQYLWFSLELQYCYNTWFTCQNFAATAVSDN